MATAEEVEQIVKQTLEEVRNQALPSKDKLLTEYRARVDDLIGSPRRNMQQLRNLKSEYLGREEISEDDLDISEKSSAISHLHPRMNDLPGR